MNFGELSQSMGQPLRVLRQPAVQHLDPADVPSVQLY
jgi:hypothetical protein